MGGSGGVDMPRDSHSVPLRCPKCGCADGGVPYAARTTHEVNLMIVALRCRECAHQWDAEKKMQRPIFSPAPARKREPGRA